MLYVSEEDAMPQRKKHPVGHIRWNSKSGYVRTFKLKAHDRDRLGITS